MIVFIWSHFSWLLSLYLTAVSQTAFLFLCYFIHVFPLKCVLYLSFWCATLPLPRNFQFLQHLSININQFSSHKRCLCVLLNTDTFIYNFFLLICNGFTLNFNPMCNHGSMFLKQFNIVSLSLF